MINSNIIKVFIFLLILANFGFAQNNINGDTISLKQTGNGNQKNSIVLNGESIIENVKPNGRDTIKFYLPSNTLMKTEDYEKLIKNPTTSMPK